MAAVCAVLVLAGPAEAKTCAEPGDRWERATAAEVGMDAAKLQAAVDYAMANNALAFRVYRHGCLVAENASAPEGTSLRTQSWSMAKGVSSVAFGRAWTLGLISPDDPVGSLLPQADEAHGRMTLRDLVTMTAGNVQALAHDFNIAMEDRIRDALTVPLIHPGGESYNYWQSAPPLVDEAVGAAAGEDFQAFFQRELLTPIGIEPQTWRWGRDRRGNTQGYFDLHMTPDDYARFGDLMRRGGVWRGRRLLSKRYVQQAVEPIAPYGCYAWFLWTHAAPECDGRSGEGNVKGFDPGMFEFNGLNQQLVTVFPQTDVVMVRVGAAGTRARPLYEHTLAAVTDQDVPMPTIEPDPDHPPFRITPTVDGPAAWIDGVVQPPLPAAGPARARAVQIRTGSTRVDAKGRFVVALACPPRLPATQASCAGRATVRGARVRAFAVAPGTRKRLRLRLRKPLRTRTAKRTLTATTSDATAAGTVARRAIAIRR